MLSRLIAVGKNAKLLLPKLLDGIELVTPEVFEHLQSQLAVTPSYLRRLLRDQTTPLDPLIEGVRQDTFENLTRTLVQLAQTYPQNPKPARSVVLEAKTHTRILIARNPDDPWRAQVLLHLNVWLENPTIYPTWASLQIRNAAKP